MSVSPATGAIPRRRQHRVTMLLLASVCLFVGLSPLSVEGDDSAGSRSEDSHPTQEQLRRRLEGSGSPPLIMAGAHRVLAAVTTKRFYEARVFEPAWTKGGQPSADAFGLLRFLRAIESEGLRSRDYHFDAIAALLDTTAADSRRLSAPKAVDLELLLTDAYLLCASHLLSGVVNPETIDSEWIAHRREADLAVTLKIALEGEGIAASLMALRPAYPEYDRLCEALKEFREARAEHSWPIIPTGPKLEEGDSGVRVDALCQRLAMEGWISDAPRNVFDAEARAAVEAFQQSLGLEADGVVGPRTLEALNVSVQSRIDQTLVNLERWRWLPKHLGDRYILVNVANYHLEVIEADHPVLEMRVVVGKSVRKTPVFSASMTYLVLNPYWTVPTKLAVEDKLPQIRKDPGYLAKQRMKVFQGWGEDARELDPRSIDWSAYGKGNFPFRLRQEPGPGNALGDVKFMFPNKFSVYLHDTSSRELFAKTERAFSSGCIRLEKPLQLATYLLGPDWPQERLRAIIAEGKERTVTLPQPIPVHLQYWTAWADDSGRLVFRSDIYDRDRAVLAALREGPPS